MKKYKIPSIIFTIIFSVSFVIFLISLITMLLIKFASGAQFIGNILLSIVGMGIFGPVSAVFLVLTIVFWSLYHHSKKHIKS